MIQQELFLCSSVEMKRGSITARRVTHVQCPDAVLQAHSIIYKSRRFLHQDEEKKDQIADTPTKKQITYLPQNIYIYDSVPPSTCSHNHLCL